VIARSRQRVFRKCFASLLSDCQNRTVKARARQQQPGIQLSNLNILNLRYE
jgi:hypothetical protein